MNLFQIHSPRQRKTPAAISQTGLVSIMVTMVLMMVITLIVLGFAQMSRREARQALDRQLSTQAFLAAETGVNDARDAIRKSLGVSRNVPDKDDCRPSTGNSPYAGYNPVLDPVNDVSYTCLLVSARIHNIVEVVAASGSSISIPLHPVNGRISTIHLKWSALEKLQPIDMTRCPAGLPSTGIDSFYKSNLWTCPYGVPRVDIVPTDSLNRDLLMQNQKAMFFYPTTATPGAVQPLDYSNARGAVSAMSCNVSGCKVDINNISGYNNYALRIQGIYAGGKLDISADDAQGTPLLLEDAQAVVDSTGKAQDVLRRVQVRLSLDPGGGNGDYAIQSGSSLCKRFGITPDTFRVPNDMRGQDANNPACSPQSFRPACIAGLSDIILVLDGSESMTWIWGDTQRIIELKKTAIDLIQNIGIGEGLHHMAIVRFSNKWGETWYGRPGGAQLLAPFTSDIQTLQNEVTNMFTVHDTHYIPGLEVAMDEFNGPRSRPGVKKVMIFISDGDTDDDDQQEPVRMAAKFKAQGGTVFTIALGMKPEDEKNLRPMAGNGGTHFSTDNPADLEEAMYSIRAAYSCT